MVHQNDSVVLIMYESLDKIGGTIRDNDVIS